MCGTPVSKRAAWRSGRRWIRIEGPFPKAYTTRFIKARVRTWTKRKVQQCNKWWLMQLCLPVLSTVSIPKRAWSEETTRSSSLASTIIINMVMLNWRCVARLLLRGRHFVHHANCYLWWQSSTTTRQQWCRYSFRRVDPWILAPSVISASVSCTPRNIAHWQKIPCATSS